MPSRRMIGHVDSTSSSASSAWYARASLRPIPDPRPTPGHGDPGPRARRPPPKGVHVVNIKAIRRGAPAQGRRRRDVSPSPGRWPSQEPQEPRCHSGARLRDGREDSTAACSSGARAPEADRASGAAGRSAGRPRSGRPAADGHVVRAQDPHDPEAVGARGRALFRAARHLRGRGGARPRRNRGATPSSRRRRSPRGPGPARPRRAR
jgi:hypothetical protein